MMSSQCPVCENYLGDLTCIAFPDRIPKKILLGKVSHTKPYPGDHGVQFSRVKLPRKQNGMSQFRVAHKSKL